MDRCDNLLLIMFSVHVIMMFIVRDDSLILVNLLLEINAHYMNILTRKCLQIQSQSIYVFFKIILEGDAPRPPNISMLCMLIVLHAMKHILGSPSLSYALLSGR